MLGKEDVSRIELDGVSYPYICDLYVLEKLQDERGDLTHVDYELRGFEPWRDANGVADMSKEGTRTVPKVGLVVKALLWMIEEGIAITGEDLTIDEKTIRYQDDYTVVELAVKAWTAFNDSFVAKKRKSPRKK